MAVVTVKPQDLVEFLELLIRAAAVALLALAVLLAVTVVQVLSFYDMQIHIL